MATHDYVIANGTGAAVRSDLNDALAAIVSNNSGTSEPATTYAYQWWADTTANVLKIRNSANNAWITLRELDGTMLIEDGSEGSPGLAFADDTNTGLFSPAADNIALTTGGGERLRINNTESVFNEPGADHDFRVESDSNTHMLFVDAGNDRVGVGTTSPATDLEVTASAPEVRISSSNTGQTSGSSVGKLSFYTSDATTPGGAGVAASIETLSSTSNGSDYQLLINKREGSGGGSCFINLGTSSTGAISFGTATSGTGSEAARIDSSGRLLVGTTSVYSPSGGGSTPVTVVDGGNHRANLVISNQTNHADAGAALVLAAHGQDWQLEATSVLKGNRDFTIKAGTNERLRIDNDGRLLVGTSTNTAPANFNAKLQIADTSYTGSISMRRDSNDAGSSSLVFGKSRGSLNGNTIVQDNDALGGIVFYGADGTDLNNDAASIYAYVDGTPGSNDMPGRLVFSTTADGASSPTERMRIQSDGSIGIGTSSITEFVDIRKDQNDFTWAQIQNQNSSSGSYAGIQFGASGNTWGLANGSSATNSNSLTFVLDAGGSNSEKMRMITGGDLLLGHSTVGAGAGFTTRLSVSGGDAAIIKSTGQGASSVFPLRVWHDATSGDNLMVQFATETSLTTRGSIRYLRSSNVIQYATTSDARLKTNINDSPSALGDLSEIRVRSFDWVEEGHASVEFGFIAQEVNEVVPLAVSVGDSGDEVNKEWGVDNSKIVPLLTKALQEAIAKIEILETKVAALEAG